eukprot:COSAG02_NODE_311_length_24966_cov_1089.426187_8_plen_150_part_00
MCLRVFGDGKRHQTSRKVRDPWSSFVNSAFSWIHAKSSAGVLFISPLQQDSSRYVATVHGSGTFQGCGLRVKNSCNLRREPQCTRVAVLFMSDRECEPEQYVYSHQEFPAERREAATTRGGGQRQSSPHDFSVSSRCPSTGTKRRWDRT